MARAHEGWVVELLAGLPAHDRDGLYAALGRLKRTLAQRADVPALADAAPVGAGHDPGGTQA